MNLIMDYVYEIYDKKIVNFLGRTFDKKLKMLKFLIKFNKTLFQIKNLHYVKFWRQQFVH